MENPSVAIIVVNWNSYEYTAACLRSLQRVTYPGIQVVLVDNGSADDSLTKLKSEFSGITYIANNANLGFTGGNNVGIEHALGKGYEYIMLLNNDTEVEPDFLDSLVEVLALDESVGAVQPKINFEYDRSLIWNAGGVFNRWTGFTRTLGYKQPDDGSFDVIRKVDWITGCCIMLPGRVIREAGMLDERYFAYYEDVDWSFRIRKAGYQLIYQPESKIYHVAGASGKSKIKNREGYQHPMVHYYNVRNHLFVVKTHLTFPYFFTAFIMQIVKIGGYCVYFLLRWRLKKLEYSFRGFLDGLRT